MATILVVDDEAPIRNLLAALFRGEGHRVLEAVHGAEALRLVGAERPDVVITDVMMPVMDGAELCRRVKAHAATTATPVILMSALGPERTAGAGADAFVQKPFDLDAIERVVSRWLRGAA